MSYPPKIHQDDNKAHMIAVMQQYPLATLISVKNNEPLVTHLPLIYKNETLIGHLDMFNPQAELLKNNQAVTVIFLDLNVTYRQVFTVPNNSQHGIM